MKKFLLGLTVLVLGFGCSKGSDSNSNKNAGVYTMNQYGQCVQSSNGQIVQSNLCQQGQYGNQYQLNQQGQCVQTSTGQQVQSNYCQQGQNGGQYQMNQYGQCVQSSTGQQVPSNYCQQGQNGGQGQHCYGPYSYNGQVYQCGIQYNCSGYTVTNVQTGQQVYCQ